MDISKQHGNEMVFLDGTYQTGWYTFTFVFHGCQDTCRLSHCITIVIENETYEGISKAVAWIKSWIMEYRIWPKILYDRLLLWRD